MTEPGERLESSSALLHCRSSGQVEHPETGRITRALSKNEAGKPRIGPPKRDSSIRTVPLPLSLAAELRLHRKDHAERVMKLGSVYDRDLDLIFANEVGEPLDLDNLRHRHFAPLLKKAGLADSGLRIYDFRSTHATTLAQEGINPKVVAERLGRSNARITLDIYTQVRPEMQREATERVELALLSGSTS